MILLFLTYFTLYDWLKVHPYHCKPICGAEVDTRTWRMDLWTRGRGEGETERGALPCVTQLDSEWEALESSSGLCDDLAGWDWGSRRQAQEGGDIYIHIIADSCCYTAEANIVKLQLKINFFKNDNNNKRIASPSPTLSPSPSNPFLLIAMDFPVVDVSRKWKHTICGPWCLSLGIMFPRFIHVVACVNTALHTS